MTLRFHPDRTLVQVPPGRQQAHLRPGLRQELKGLRTGSHHHRAQRWQHHIRGLQRVYGRRLCVQQDLLSGRLHWLQL
jgi:hypothetical protein